MRQAQKTSRTRTLSASKIHTPVARKAQEQSEARCRSGFPGKSTQGGSALANKGSSPPQTTPLHRCSRSPRQNTAVCGFATLSEDPSLPSPQTTSAHCRSGSNAWRNTFQVWLCNGKNNHNGSCTLLPDICSRLPIPSRLKSRHNATRLPSAVVHARPRVHTRHQQARPLWRALRWRPQPRQQALDHQQAHQRIPARYRCNKSGRREPYARCYQGFPPSCGTHSLPNQAPYVPVPFAVAPPPPRTTGPPRFLTASCSTVTWGTPFSLWFLLRSDFSSLLVAVRSILMPEDIIETDDDVRAVVLATPFSF